MQEVNRLAPFETDVIRLAGALGVDPAEAVETAIAVLTAPKHEDDPVVAKVELAELKVEQLKALAEEQGIDLAGATLKADIVAAIEAAQAAADDAQQ